MRLATILEAGRLAVALVDDRGMRVLDLHDQGLGSIRAIAARGEEALAAIAEWADGRPGGDFRPLDDVEYGPAVPNPGAIYTIGLNYRDPDDDSGDDSGRPDRPLVYGKLPTSVTGHGATVDWDRSLTENVDGECELGVVIGAEAFEVSPADAMDHVFGWTVINDISSRDPWLDGDQWLLGKSMAGFCPVGPWVVTADELDPRDLRLACAIDGRPIQDGRTSEMRFSIAEIVSYLSHHTVLRPGDLIATGTPPRLPGPLGPDRHLEPGDVLTAWIEGIGELTVSIG